jgi:very-short-patch-repair endonuclease
MTKIYNKNKNQPIRKKLRQTMNKSEIILWSKIKNDRLGYRFRRQHGIGNYIVDFYCPKLKLVIEIDGVTHLDESVYDNDVVRQKYLESLGLKVIRFTSTEILLNIQEVLKTLFIVCKQREKEK